MLAKLTLTNPMYFPIIINKEDRSDKMGTEANKNPHLLNCSYLFPKSKGYLKDRREQFNI